MRLKYSLSGEFYQKKNYNFILFSTDKISFKYSFVFLPTIISNLPFSTIYSKSLVTIARSFMFNFRFTVAVSPDFINTFSKPFNCFVGVRTELMTSLTNISTVSLPSILPLFVTSTDTVISSSFFIVFFDKRRFEYSNSE